LQEAPDQREQSLILGNALEHLAAPDQRIDPLGGEALEGVAAMMRAEMRGKAGADLVQRFGV